VGISRDFGVLLREARDRVGISQEELAFRADLHRTYVSMVERGIHCPTLKALFGLCRAIDIKPASIIASLEARVAKRRAQKSV